MSFMPTALLAKDQMLNAHMPILLQLCASEMVVLACHLQRFYVWEILFSAHAYFKLQLDVMLVQSHTVHMACHQCNP